MFQAAIQDFFFAKRSNTVSTETFFEDLPYVAGVFNTLHVKEQLCGGLRQRWI